jgi:hypothetical protein
MIACDHFPFDQGGRAMGWDVEKWFFDAAVISVREDQEDTPLVRLRFHKPDDENPYWDLEENRFIDVTEDQAFLREDGKITMACDLKPGDSLQHYCGTGHRSDVESVTRIEPRKAAAFSVNPFGYLIVRGGIIAKGNR